MQTAHAIAIKRRACRCCASHGRPTQRSMATTPGVVSVIIDDTNEAFQYDELDTWERVDMTGMYFNTSHVAQFVETNRGDVLNYVQILFEGASLLHFCP